jgi:hypothetical protein
MQGLGKAEEYATIFSRYHIEAVAQENRRYIKLFQLVKPLAAPVSGRCLAIIGMRVYYRGEHAPFLHHPHRSHL